MLGLDVVSVGQVEEKDGSYHSIEMGLDGRYLRFLFHDSCLAGAILVGDASLTAAAKGAVEQRTDFTAVLRKSPTATDIAEVLMELEG